MHNEIKCLALKLILSIDGGGIRGILPAEILAHLEKRVRKESGDDNLRIAHCFDLLAGTSAGGILTALYLTPDPNNPKMPKYDAAYIAELYSELGQRLFKKSPAYILRSAAGLIRARYDEEPLYKFAREVIGDIYISELFKDCLITAYDLSSRKALLFSKYSTQKYGEMADYKLCEIACATSAAPSYFIPAAVKARDGGGRNLVDGGVYAGNPSMCALVEAIKIWPGVAVEELHMVSIGCGKVVRPYHHSKTRHFGYLQWLNPILDILISSVAETTDYQVMQMFHLAGALKNYTRIEPSILNADPRIDNIKPENIKRLKSAAKNYIDHNAIIADSLCNLVLNNITLPTCL